MIGFKRFIIEMTMKAGSLEHRLGSDLPFYQLLLADGEHCGDIEEFEIYKKERKGLWDYAAFLNKEVVAYFTLDKNEIVAAFVKKEFRKKGLFSAFLFFLKRNENISQILLGEIQSKDTIEAVKRIHTRFKTSWVNGSKKEKFDPNIEEPYYSNMSPTGWKIMLENDGDFSHWPKFFNRDLREGGRILEMLYFETFIEDEK